MSTTKEIKTLLEELRRQLDPELVPHVEPTLRKILDAAKPKTVTEVVCRSDPKDRAEIESLRAQLHAKDETIRNLHFKLAAPPPLLDHMPFDEMVREWDKRGRAWSECMIACMKLMSRSEAYRRRRHTALDRCMRLSLLGLLNYLSLFDGCSRMDPGTLRKIVDKPWTETLRKVAHDIHAASGITVDLSLLPLDDLPPGEEPVSVEPTVVFVAADGQGPNPATG